MPPQDPSRRAAFAALGVAGAGLALAGCARGEKPAKPAEAPDVSATEDLMREHGILRRLLVVYRESAAVIRNAPKTLDLDLTGVRQIALRVTDGGDGFEFDHADWAEAQESEQGGLEEIVVTARKRAENAQDVPIAITTLSDSKLKELGANNMGELVEHVPNFDWDPVGINALSSWGLRGIVDQSRNAGQESGLGIYVDGVFIGRPVGFIRPTRSSPALDCTSTRRLSRLRVSNPPTAWTRTYPFSSTCRT